MTAHLHTERLVLRAWLPEDREPFAELNADPAVTEHLPGRTSRVQSDELADRIATHFAVHGYGFWAVEGEGRFAGFAGLQWSDVTGERALEVGWRLARWAWGRGWATEAAVAALDVGLRQAPEVVSFTAVTNVRSIAVMERLGMRRVREFDHPRPDLPDRLRRHVLYVTP